MATSAIISVSNLDINKVSFGDIRMNKAGGKTVPIKYNGQNLQIRLPKSMYPMGINIRDTENGASYQLALTLKGCDSFAKERATTETAGELGSLYNFLQDMQEKLLQTSMTNSVKWFSKSRTREILADSMKQFLSPSVEKINGEWVPTGKYPPSFRMKVPVYDGRVTMDVSDHSGKPIEVDTENIGAVFPKRVEASVVVAPSVYISNQTFGVTWRVTYARVSPPQRLTAAQVFADEIDEEVAAPAAAPALERAPVQSSLAHEELDQDEELEVPTAPPAPAPAPSGPKSAGNRRRVPAA